MKFILNPKEKANELFYKFYDLKKEVKGCRNPIYSLSSSASKECALLLVSEITETQHLSGADYLSGEYNPLHCLNYWVEVEKEINKL